MSDLHPTGSNGSPKELENARRGRVKRFLHWWFIELWWVHIIAIIVITLCITLPLVYVGYPRFTQQDINKGVINITGMSLTEPTPDGFILNLTTVLTPHTFFHSRLYAWRGYSYLSGSNQSFFDQTVPYVKTINHAVTNANSRINLTQAQLPEFTKFVTQLVASSTVQTWLVGKGQSKLGGLPKINVHYNKSLVAQGFDGMKGVTTTDLHLLTTAQPDGANLAGKVNIPNPTNGTMDLGNVTFGVSIPAYILNTTYPTPLGYATINNTRILPNRTNTFDLRSVSNQTVVAEAVAKNGSILTKGLPVTTVVRQVEFNGQTIPWLIEALAANPIQQVLNISQALSGR